MHQGKSRLLRGLAGGATFAAVLCFAGTGSAQITGSAHDLRTFLSNGEDEICVPCHTPHNAQITPDGPLWNHAVTAESYSVYSSGTFDAAPGQPTGVSLLCLSCHDGSLGADAYGGVTTGTDLLSGAVLLGTDLSNDHPVSFTYNAALATADGELHDPTATASGVGSGNIDDDMLFGSGNDQLECASCHDPHKTTYSRFLIKDNLASALCLTCHDK